ncbi:MAG: homoserine kinase [Opitutales bacterium]
MPENSVLVRAPASTSNCGPGFDTLGIALALYNFIRITPRSDARIQSVGETACEGTEAMVAAAANAFAAYSGRPHPGFDCEIWGAVPSARGLGSSATVRAGVLAGLNALAGSPLDTEDLIRLTTALDNAPDNACATLSGGFCIARTDPETSEYRSHIRFELPESLVALVASPDYEVLTEDARLVLPEELPFKDAVRSANSLAFLVAALAAGDFSRLRGAVDDRLHEPYREKLNPFAPESIAAGCEAGAYAGWLSGSGSSVLCLSDSACAGEAGNAMQAVYENNGVECRLFRLTVDNQGLQVE